MTVPTVLRAERWADVDAGEVRSPALIMVDGQRIQVVNPVEPLPDTATVIDLGDVTLLPGLMDMELNLLIGGPGGPEGGEGPRPPGERPLLTHAARPHRTHTALTPHHERTPGPGG